MSILYRRALLLAELETTFRTDPTPTAADNAFLVSDPQFNTDLTLLDRNNVKVHLSPDPGRVGRKIASVTFQHEVRGNGVTDGSTAPYLGALLQACGMAETNFVTGSGATIIDDAPIPLWGSATGAPAGAFTFTKTTDTTDTLPRVTSLECTTGGGSGVAQFTVFSPAVGSLQTEYSQTAVTMTDALAFALSGGAEITPTVTTDFAVGDTFVIHTAPSGHYYTPVSDPDSMKSVTIYLYYDGLRHIVTGARGTFSVSAEAGGYALFTFTFTGDYYDPTDQAMPTTPTYETTLPNQVEFANLYAGGAEAGVDFALCAQAFSVDIANNVIARECINEENSLAGGLITGRNPVATMNPEMELEATHPFWATLSNGSRVGWGARIGRAQGNVVMFNAPYAQYTGITYGNRNDIRIYDVNMRLAAATGSGNDELRITFS